jgi:hypothetical protein
MFIVVCYKQGTCSYWHVADLSSAFRSTGLDRVVGFRPLRPDRLVYRAVVAELCQRWNLWRVLRCRYRPELRSALQTDPVL